MARKSAVDPVVTPLKRTAIIVRDLDRSLLFYHGVLGMNVWVQGTAGEELPAMYQLLGMPPCKTRWVILQSEDVAWGMVGLFELSDPAPDDDTHRNIDRANRGEACLVFHTPDVAKIYRGARAMGLTVLCPPLRLDLKQHGVASKEMTLRDPNGVLVNFIQNIKGNGRMELANRFPGLRKATPAARSRAKPKTRTKPKLRTPKAKASAAKAKAKR